jgi:hypothetical protein
MNEEFIDLVYQLVSKNMKVIGIKQANCREIIQVDYVCAHLFPPFDMVIYTE